jgi:hypothetical protein
MFSFYFVGFVFADLGTLEPLRGPMGAPKLNLNQLGIFIWNLRFWFLDRSYFNSNIKD